MDAEKLRGELTKLHQELSTVETVDAPTKEMLVTVMQDIAHLLTGDKPTGENAPSSDSPFQASLALLSPRLCVTFTLALLAELASVRRHPPARAARAKCRSLRLAPP